MLVAGAFSASLAGAQKYKAGSIEFDQPWSTATPQGASVGAGYLTIKNTGTQSDVLTGAWGCANECTTPLPRPGRG
jgi:copper(I)-binding protein